MKISFNHDNTQIFAVSDEQIIGYVDITIPDDYSTNRNLEIKYVYVNPLFRRKGVASEMLIYFLSNIKDVVWVSLWTSRECELDKSFNLYLNMGFEEKVYLQDYYEDGIGTRYFIKRMK